MQCPTQYPVIRTLKPLCCDLPPKTTSTPHTSSKNGAPCAFCAATELSPRSIETQGRGATPPHALTISSSCNQFSHSILINNPAIAGGSTEPFLCYISCYTSYNTQLSSKLLLYQAIKLVRRPPAYRRLKSIPAAHLHFSIKKPSAAASVRRADRPNELIDFSLR